MICVSGAAHVEAAAQHSFALTEQSCVSRLRSHFEPQVVGYAVTLTSNQLDHHTGLLMGEDRTLVVAVTHRYARKYTTSLLATVGH